MIQPLVEFWLPYVKLKSLISVGNFSERLRPVEVFAMK